MSELRINELSRELETAIAGLKSSKGFEQTGLVTRFSDDVAWIYGLQGCGFGELLEIETPTGKTGALVLSLGEDEIGTIMLGREQSIRPGSKVKLTGHSPEIPVGPELLGRVIDPLGRPLDGLGPIKTKQTAALERPSPGVIDRQAVTEPLATGVMAIDAMIPVGLGQRELIIGDRKTGKTAIAIDTIVNQARQKTDVICIYVAIGQKQSAVAQLVERLKDEEAMARSIIIVTSPADAASLLYLAPYAGTAIGEHFRDQGGNALVIYDDLSKHAIAYRQLSLLLRRPPGREAYPGDVFYLHARLLERAAKLSDKLGGGSLTALPIIETQAGDISAYIPTNTISITDGQIFLESDLFYQGIRPAISVGLSVSRVGSVAQPLAIKDLAGSLRVDLAQFRELAAFTQFSNDLDDKTEREIVRGRILTEILKQKQLQPYSLAQEVIILLAATRGTFDRLSPNDVESVVQAFIRRVQQTYPKLIKLLDGGTKLNDRMIKAILKSAELVVQAAVPESSEVEAG